MIAPLTILFFASGACALVYQVMWLRMLALVFGVTVYAASTVLASFMAGLALGSYGAGRLAGRLRSPLMAFGLVEIAVGLTAVATPLLLEAATSAWIATQPSLPSSIAIITLARFAAALAVLIVPTTLMGATLPLVIESAFVRDRAIATRIGLLYAANTSGAIGGALVAGFYLVSHVGVADSLRWAAATNVLIGVLALALSYRQRSRPGVAVAETLDGPSAMRPAELSRLSQRAVLWTFAVSGFFSLAIEIVWFRMLVIFLRPTAYAFTIMLAAVLAGIAIGSAIATPLLRRRAPWLAILTVTQLAIAVTAVLSFNALVYLQAASTRAEPLLVALGFDPYFARIVMAGVLAMLPTTLLLGFAFPVGLSLFTAHRRDHARGVGAFYSLNVIGAIGGAVASGFLILPTLGSRGSLMALSALALASSAMLALTQWRTRPNFAGFVLVAGPVAFVMSALNAADPFAIADAELHRGERVLWREEGVQTTVAVHQRGGSQPMRILYLDGMHQSDDAPSTIFVHHRIGALPVLLHPNPKHALVVGLGGGATPGAVAQFPGVNVDVVELSDAVVHGASFFSHINFNVLQRPNVTLRVDDGRNYLLTTRKKYDVVTADLMLPRHAGAGALYAREYFELVRRALADGGVVLQWNPPDSETSYKMILRTFMSVFPHTTLWGDGTLMLGSVRPYKLSATAYQDRRRDPRVRALFDWDIDVLRRAFVGGGDDLRRWAGDGPILTDDKPTLEYFLALPKDDPPVNWDTLTAQFDDILRP